MSKFVAHTSAGMLSAHHPGSVGRKLDRQLERMDAHSMAVCHADALNISRAEQATARGLIAVGQISSLEASLVRVLPHAEGRLQAIADAGTIGIAGIVALSGL
jgi:hypothetical protein